FLQVSCLSVLRLPYDKRCMMIQRVPNCRAILGYFNYFEMMYCLFHVHNKFVEICVMLIFVTIAFNYLLLMSIIVDSYFMPVLKILAVKMRMSESVAGATLFAFGTSCPDFVANLLPIREDSAMFAGTIADSVVAMLLCAGLICYMKPFKMDWFVVVRDLLFLWLAVELLRYLMFYNNRMSTTDSIVLLSLYLLYLVIIVADVHLLRLTTKSEFTPSRMWLVNRFQFLAELQREILALQQLSYSPDRYAKLQRKINALRNLRDHDTVNIRRSSVRSQPKSELVDFQATRTILHNASNPKNCLLWSDLLASLNPIDATDWKLAGRCERLYILIKCPMRLLVTVLVPVVDYEHYKHGWSKLLNCTQIVTNTFFVITAVHSKLDHLYSSWYADFNVAYSKWSLCLTVPLAIVTFCHARTDVPPPYHSLFIVLSASSSLVLIVICTSEIEVLMAIVGIVCHLSDHFMNITFGSMGNAVINLMASYAMTSQGYEKLAFTGVFASPFFNSVVTMGVAFFYNRKVHEAGSSSWLNGEHGDNCYIFIFITIVSTLWWLLILNFTPRRSVAVFCWVLFLLFIVYAVAVEWDLIHELAKDEFFQPR
ncbi:hypothetical protein KR044_000729, partial [Drosophila immigrans]